MAEPFKLRDYQEKTISFIVESLKNTGSCIVESPTGSGKTVMGIYGALLSRGDPKRRILYLTRTNSQQEQIIRELRKLSPSFGVSTVPLQGRANLCILYKEGEDREQVSAESLSRFCSFRKRAVLKGDQNACEYYNPGIRDPDTEKYIYNSIPMADELYDFGITRGICPYESLKSAMERADIVIAPYSYFITPIMAERLLHNWGVTRKDLIVILDEAHNLPDIARDSSVTEISVHQINLAEREAMDFGDPILREKIRASDFTEMTRSAILSMVSDLLGEAEEIRIRPEELRDYVMIQNHISSEFYDSLVTYTQMYGEHIAEEREKDGKIPKSHVLSFSWNLMRWQQSDPSDYVCTLSRNKEGMLQSSSLDPSAILKPLWESKTIHLSGTLKPVDVYKDIIGLNNSPHLINESIFPRENRLIVYNDDVTTKFGEFDSSQAKKMLDLIEGIFSSVRRNTIVYFPSYAAMDMVCGQGFGIQYLKERRDLDQIGFQQLIREFRKGGKPLFAVSGGRISEGMNFPGMELEMVIIAGIPYPRPDARQKAIQEYYEFRYHRGWEYAVTFPVSVKLRQAIGRLIRSSDDIGMAIILDKRASYFRKYIEDMYLSKDPSADAAAFFSNRKLFA